MTAAEIQNAIIPRIKAHTGRPVIEADQAGEVPETPHILFKIIVPYAAGVGRPEIRSEQDAAGFRRVQSEEYRLTFSFTAIAEDSDAATALAQVARDWFDFYGYEELNALGVVVHNLGDVGNRDSVNDEETREGFDAILRTKRELVKAAQYIDAVEINKE